MKEIDNYIKFMKELDESIKFERISNEHKTKDFFNKRPIKYVTIQMTVVDKNYDVFKDISKKLEQLQTENKKLKQLLAHCFEEGLIGE